MSEPSKGGASQKFKNHCIKQKQATKVSRDESAKASSSSLCTTQIGPADRKNKQIL